MSGLFKNGSGLGPIPPSMVTGPRISFTRLTIGGNTRAWGRPASWRVHASPSAAAPPSPNVMPVAPTFAAEAPCVDTESDAATDRLSTRLIVIELVGPSKADE